MRLTKFLTSAAMVAVLSGVVHAGPIVFPTVSIDPNDVLAPQTTGNLQQVCPTGGLTCPLGSPFSAPANNFFVIQMLNDGLFSAEIIGSITPGGTGSYTFLDFDLTDLSNNSLAAGALGSPIQDLFLEAGTYRMWVDYLYLANRDNGSASWSMAMTSSPVNPIPEPGTLALIGLALTGLALSRRKKIH